MIDELIERERKLSFNFFYDNFSREPSTFGLTHDMYPTIHNDCSVAASGYMLAAMAVGADFGYISKKEGEDICLKTLKTFKKLERREGFYYHFYDMYSGKRTRNSELSNIDTALFLAGALTAGGYFGGEILGLAREIAKEVNWEFFYDKKRKYFYLAEFDDKGLVGNWDVYAEQLIMYFLAAAYEKGKDIAEEAYYSFNRMRGEYGGHKFVYGWFGSIFIHQFSHAFLDFKDTRDKNGDNWFDNTVEATLANRQFCIDNSDKFKGYGKTSWGLTSCLTVTGYRGHLGTPPSGNNNTEHIVEGTVAPCGALGSFPFTPKESGAALEHYYSEPKLVGKYGLYDAYNSDENWFSDGYIGIDKGITLLMLANYEKQTVWRSFCSLPEIKQAFTALRFKKERN